MQCEVAGCGGRHGHNWACADRRRARRCGGENQSGRRARPSASPSSDAGLLPMCYPATASATVPIRGLRASTGFVTHVLPSDGEAADRLASMSEMFRRFGAGDPT